MVPADLWAYPVLLFAIYGVFRVGRPEQSAPWDPFEWARAAVLGILVGVLLAVTVHLVLVGRVSSEPTMMAGALGIAAAVLLVGLHVFEMFGEHRIRRDA